MANRVIYHIDIDSFFVSVERTKNAYLKNKPVAVARDHKRSIITAASYEAKALGIKVGMPIYEAKVLVPNLIYVTPDMQAYNDKSSEIFDYIADLVDAPMQVYSIDECFLDVTKIVKKNKSITSLAYRIQQGILEKFDIPVSIGIGHNIFNAKMSTKLKKPFGVTLTKPWQFAKRFHHLEIKEFFGIGNGILRELAKYEIKTIGDFCTKATSEVYLRQKLGIYYKELVANCQGTSSDFVDDDYNKLKGIGNSVTFIGDDQATYEEIFQSLYQMLDKSWRRLEQRAYISFNVAINLRSHEKKWKTFQHKLKEPMLAKSDAKREIMKLLHASWDQKPLRGVGVRFTDLVNKFSYTQNEKLFETSQYSLPPNQRSLISHLNLQMHENVFFTLKELEVNKSRNKKQSRYLMRDHIFKVEE